MIMPTFDEFEEQRYLELKRSFDKYYQDTIQPLLRRKEDMRLKYVNRFWFLTLMSAIVLPMIALIIFFFNHYYQKDIDWGFLYIPIVIAIYVVRAPFAAYRKRIKKDVMGLFVRFFDGFVYKYRKGMPVETIRESRIFPLFDIADADDCFNGNYEGVAITVYEQILKKRIYQPKGKTKIETVFRGIAVELGMNKNFNGQTIAVRDSGIFNMFQKYDGLERVKLEDVVFEKIFEVYSSDQIEARYLLTPAFMERLLKLRSLYTGKRIDASFFDNKILIAIDTRQDMFEPCSFFKSNLNKKKFDIVFEQFWTVFSIIHVLKLNQKLGL